MEMNTNEHFSAKKGKTSKQRFLLDLAHNNFNIAKACRSTGISRGTYYQWLEKYPWFAIKVDELHEARLDLYEQALHQNILNGDTQSIIFALKTKGRSRGYSERNYVDKRVVKLLHAARCYKITVREAAFRINAMGLAVPEVLKIELSKAPVEEQNSGVDVPTEELELKAKAAMEAVMNQREYFVPQRKTEVMALKQALEGDDAFRT